MLIVHYDPNTESRYAYKYKLYVDKSDETPPQFSIYFLNN